MQNVLKNKKVVMIVAMVLMVALVAGMGAMTYSRYVSSANMDKAATATVAKWGYVVKFDTTNMFGANYELKANNLAVVKNEGNDVVSAVATDFIVAPGTSGYMTIKVDGVAEVLAQLSVKVAEGYKDITLFLADDGNDETKDVYMPVKWTLKDGDNVVNGCNKTTLEEIKKQLVLYSTDIEVGQALDKTLTIEWEWALDSGNDDLDTILGLLAASKSLSTEQSALLKADATHITSITFDLSATVKQIQDSN